MIDTLRELANFYSQQFHVKVELVTSSGLVDNWDKQGILIGLPANAEEAKRVNDLKMLYDPSFGQSLEGKEVNVAHLPVAKVGESHLILLFNPQNPPAETLARKLIEEAVPRMARHIRQQQLKQFLENMQSIADNVRRERESGIQSNDWEIERLSQQIHDLSRKIGADRMMLKFFERSEDQLKQKAIRMHVDLQKLVPGLYSGFRLEEDNIIGTTQPININFDDYEYRFDPYQIEVNIREGKVQIAGSSNEVNGYIHPHISDGSICWGNIGPAITRLQGELELHGLFQLVHQFLSTYNEDDPFQRIEHWNPNWEEEMDEDSPYCEWCDDYGHSTADCMGCWWCRDCDEYHSVDEECPNQREAEDEQQAA